MAHYWIWFLCLLTLYIAHSQVATILFSPCVLSCFPSYTQMSLNWAPLHNIQLCVYSYSLMVDSQLWDLGIKCHESLNLFWTFEHFPKRICHFTWVPAAKFGSEYIRYIWKFRWRWGFMLVLVCRWLLVEQNTFLTCRKQLDSYVCDFSVCVLFLCLLSV